MTPNAAGQVKRALFSLASVVGIAMLVTTNADGARGQDWGMRLSTPRLVSAGPLWTTPVSVQGLRSDRYYSLVVTGSIMLGKEHYGRYYKGYYGDAGYRWESRGDINYPGQTPERSGVVATNLGVGLADSDYQQNHIYHTNWFVPSTSTMTIQLAVLPCPENMGQLHFSLLELHPDFNPNQYVFNSASGTWYHNSEIMGQPIQGVRPESFWDSVAILPPQGVHVDGFNAFQPSGNVQPVLWDEPQGVCIDATHALFPADGNQPAGTGTSGGFSLPPFQGNRGILPADSGFGPADVDLAPGFSSTLPTQNTNRPTSNGDSINLLDQIAPPVRY